tara:strand:- start:52 stop:456 length:405 start_codon:yes stop_codon:yes gene_type:complete
MSGDTVTGKALQFTNDNKYAYAASGAVADSSSSAAVQTLFKFVTGSYYIVANINVITTHEGSAGIYLNAIINGESVFNGLTDDGPTMYEAMPLNILIPPNSDFELKFGSSTNTTMSAVLVGEVGMAPRVGNLDE